MDEAIVLPLFYIGKVEGGKVVKITLGPFCDSDEAQGNALKKYGWGCSDYKVLTVNQSFSIFSDVRC